MKNAIFSENGIKLAGDKEITLPEYILKKTFPVVENGCLYSKLSDGNISVISADEKYLSAFADNTTGHITRNEFVKNLLFGKTVNDLKSLCGKYAFSYEEVRRVFVAEAASDISNYISSIEEMFSEDDIVVTALDSHRIAVIGEENDIEDPLEMASAINSMFSEMNTECNVGVSCICDNASGLAEAFEQSLAAIRMGKKISYGGGVWIFANILPELIISSMPKENLNELKQKAEKICRSLDSETIELAQEFFKHNLNISETARYCYLHRNTLIYRLDRIQKETGLNMRNFDEAVALRVYIAANKILK